MERNERLSLGRAQRKRCWRFHHGKLWAHVLLHFMGIQLCLLHALTCVEKQCSWTKSFSEPRCVIFGGQTGTVPEIQRLLSEERVELFCKISSWSYLYDIHWWIKWKTSLSNPQIKKISVCTQCAERPCGAFPSDLYLALCSRHLCLSIMANICHKFLRPDTNFWWNLHAYRVTVLSGFPCIPKQQLHLNRDQSAWLPQTSPFLNRDRPPVFPLVSKENHQSQLHNHLFLLAGGVSSLSASLPWSQSCHRWQNLAFSYQDF